MANHRLQPKSTPGSFVSLADIDPDLLSGLGESERAEATRVLLPVLDAPNGAVELAELLASTGSFGAIVLEGMLQHHTRIWGQPGVRLLAPGDIIGAHAGPCPTVVAGSEWRAGAGTRLALLSEGFLFAVRRWPEIVANLQIRTGEQTDRLAAQLAICQLPRVEDRLLAMLWLLAESWGRVTTVGTTLPLSLTHEALGALIGARRPTVTLALGELAERGAVVHQDRGWLLLQALPQVLAASPEIDAAEVLGDGPTDWIGPTPPTVGSNGEVGAELAAAFDRLRAQHLRSAEQVQLQRRRTTAVSARARELFESVREQRAVRPLPPRPPPSS